MTITKHYCDYCEKEISERLICTITAKIDGPDRPYGGRDEREYSGEFCSRRCACDYVYSEGEKLPKVEAA